MLQRLNHCGWGEKKKRKKAENAESAFASSPSLYIDAVHKYFTRCQHIKRYSSWTRSLTEKQNKKKKQFGLWWINQQIKKDHWDELIAPGKNICLSISKRNKMIIWLHKVLANSASRGRNVCVYAMQLVSIVIFVRRAVNISPCLLEMYGETCRPRATVR